MAGPVLDRADERPRLAQPVEQDAHDLAVLVTARTGHVVGRTRLPVVQDMQDGAGMVGHVQPIALLAAVAVERQLAVVQGVGHEERDELLGMLIRGRRCSSRA